MKFERALTVMEYEVLRVLARGVSIKEAGAILNRSTKTIDAHVYNMRMKVGASTMLSLILSAVWSGVVPIEDLSYFHFKIFKPVEMQEKEGT